jgi:undecaprenyl-diphosphatase
MAQHGEGAVSLNERVFLAVNGLAHHSRVADYVMVATAQAVPFLLAGMLLVAWFWQRREPNHAAFRAATSGLLGLGLAPLIGMAHYQPVPAGLGLGQQLIVHVANNSFPSEHASVAFGVAVSLLLSRNRLWPAALALAVLVGFARIFVGVHFPADVLAGAAAGTLAGLVTHVGRKPIDTLAEFVHRFQRRALLVLWHRDVRS